MGNAATLGVLNVITTMDNSNLVKESGTLQSKLNSLQSSFSNLIPSFNLVSVAAAACGAAIAAAFKGLNSLDQMANNAAKIGLDSANSLQRLTTAASLCDVESESLNASLGKMLRTLGDAQTGSKSAIAAFNDIGLSIEDLKGKDATEQFAMIAEALNRIEDPSIKASMGAKVLGKGFKDLIPLIDQGSEGIERLAAKSEQFGQILTDEQTARVNGANASLDELSQAADGATKQLAASLSPAIEGLSDVGQSLLIDVLKPILPILTGLASLIGFVAKIIATTLTAAIAGLHVALTAVLKIGGLFSDTLKSWADASEQGLSGYWDRLQGIWSDTDGLTTATKGYGDAAEDAFTRAGDAAKSAAEIQADLLEKTQKSAAEMKEQLQFDIKTFGMSSNEKAIAKLRENEGLDGTNSLKYEINKVEELQKQLSLLEEKKKREEDIQKGAKAFMEWTRVTNDKLQSAAKAYGKEMEDNHKKRIADEKKANEERIKALKDSAKSDSDRKMEQTIAAAKALNAGEITPEEYGRIRKNIEGDQREEMGTRNPMPFTGAALFGSQDARDTLLRSAARGSGGGDPWKIQFTKEDELIRIGKEQLALQKKNNREQIVKI